MTPITVLTVPHTGTHFLASIFNNAKVPYVRSHYGVGRDHLDLDESFIVSTLRDPVKTFKTWYYRNHLDKHGMQFIDCWLEYDWYTKNENVFILPIDTQDREEKLKQLSNKIGLTLSTDWEPVSSMGDKPDLDKNSGVPVFYLNALEKVKKLSIVKRYIQ